MKETWIFRVTLRHIKPAIWRKIHVDPEMTFSDLHRVLQIAMGWENSHLHKFEVHGKEIQSDLEQQENWGADISDMLDGDETQLNSLLKKKGEKFAYTYDFGDGWEHDIVFEGTFKADDDDLIPCCAEGERNCPPEDVGGPGGYEEFLKAIKNKRHPEHKEMLEWVGGEFDPEFFVADLINVIMHTSEEEFQALIDHFEGEDDDDDLDEDDHPLINRTSILISAKKPFKDWVNYATGPTEDDAYDASTYLVSDLENEAEMLVWLEESFDRIFKAELYNWTPDRTLWPQTRTFEIFKEWFNFSLSAMVYDLDSENELDVY